MAERKRNKEIHFYVTEEERKLIRRKMIESKTKNMGAYLRKMASSNKIQKRIENLESEQDATVREKQELQKKQKTLEIIQQNFTALLDAPEISSDLLPAKREPVSVTREK